ncbi:hypothetical protein E2P84_20470 [Burkholderia cepacia]|uniref:Uncharacterized protein n=1 Tax=Burkholderia cepacia TaxID=292 RepID=A0AAX2RIV6_BURCE|nr:hypothetical protein [Burkholderia cepacia]TES73982.1 hypothetical protein E2P84_20470 [Burkholderia cepacia]TET05344.1 hypothetical protein E3D36_00085 [Burkholderia cepacia]TEU40317.1 hypothetical protein E3D37_28865 [Burkholderia cepacia]TEU42422.1 hypothetical protein E3D39_15805 [Burkholderia cepacia]TEU57453.1 hypothetical protein E3D38_03230 [Burkholderia cepacia]
MVERKKFMVAGLHGNRTVEAEQFATFAHYIQNVQFRFVVTHVPGDPAICVTHRDSGKRVCAIPFASIQAALGDYEAAAQSALKATIERAGEARVRAVLSAA